MNGADIINKININGTIRLKYLFKNNEYGININGIIGKKYLCPIIKLTNQLYLIMSDFPRTNINNRIDKTISFFRLYLIKNGTYNING